MDENKELLIKAIENEIRHIEDYMYNELGLDRNKVEEFYRLVDLEVEKELKEEFKNFAERKDMSNEKSLIIKIDEEKIIRISEKDV